MSLVQFMSNDCLHRSIKRKFQDYVDDDLSSYDLVSFRMKKDDPNPNSPSSSWSVNFPPDQITVQQKSSSSSSVKDDAVLCRPNSIQFFVRMISDGKTLVLHGKPEDKVQSIHEKIQSVAGIPVAEQRLIYGGKQLQSEYSLSECMITNDSGLHLVGRMRSTVYPEAWQVIDDLVSRIWRLCKGDVGVRLTSVKSKLMEFLSMTPKHDIGLAAPHLSILTSSCVPKALVMLYMSPHKGNKECAEQSIQHFITSSSALLPKTIYSQSLPIVLEFCKLLRRAAECDDPLYKLCRSSLGAMVTHAKNFGGGGNNRVIITLQEIFPFAAELASKLSEGLVSSMESVKNSGPAPSDVHDFVAFLQPFKAAVKDQVAFPISVPTSRNIAYQSNKIKFLYVLFSDLLATLLMCLNRMEDLVMKKKGDGGWDQYLAILKELHDISKLYEGAEEYFWTNLRHNKLSLCHLIVRYAKRGEDYEWILEHKDLTNFESRRHLVMLLLPEVKDEYGKLYEMLIDRSQLLAESFEYIAHVEPDKLRAGLFMEFKNEEATGPGVLREWFFLVCQEIFNTKTALFVACPNDCRRVFPNPVSKVDPLHLEYFSFAGRIMALALMHKVQVGIVLDLAFFLQLSGTSVSLEDIKDADPYLYSSCRQILDMDPLTVDQDVLGLTFVWEVEELGSMKVVELCPGGKSIIVNSRNRKEYVELLIQRRFVTSITEQISHFARGFIDIVGEAKIHKLCFNSLELEDLDGMLHGSESAISIEDWKAHTEYNGYMETDLQISWFWKIVGGMTAERRKVLLFFWISVKYLPVDGFGGLASKLYIYKSNESFDHLPSAHTCFYRICFPAYPSMSMMQDRLNIITQQHVGCSFGTW